MRHLVRSADVVHREEGPRVRRRLHTGRADHRFRHRLLHPARAALPRKVPEQHAYVSRVATMFRNYLNLMMCSVLGSVLVIGGLYLLLWGKRQEALRCPPKDAQDDKEQQQQQGQN